MKKKPAHTQTVQERERESKTRLLLHNLLISLVSAHIKAGLEKIRSHFIDSVKDQNTMFDSLFCYKDGGVCP